MYYKVKVGTKEHSLILEFVNDRNKWSSPEIKEKLEKILGITNTKLLASPSKLVIDWTDHEKVSDDIRSQFSKKDRDGQYDAKKASKINKEWVSFCKSFGLNRVGFSDLLFSLGGKWIFYPPIKLYEMFGDFYFECESRGIEKEECLEKIEEHEYYLIKSNWSKENKAKEGK